MEMKPISFEDALAIYDEEPSLDEVEIKPIEEPEAVYRAEENRD